MNSKYRIFVSMPMHGKSASEIAKMLNYVKKAVANAKTTKPTKKTSNNLAFLHEGLNLYDNYEIICTSDWPALDETMLKNSNEPRLKYLARAINILADCNIAIFCPGWINAAGCNVEYTACKLYYIPTFQLEKDHTTITFLRG